MAPTAAARSKSAGARPTGCDGGPCFIGPAAPGLTRSHLLRYRSLGPLGSALHPMIPVLSKRGTRRLRTKLRNEQIPMCDTHTQCAGAGVEHGELESLAKPLLQGVAPGASSPAKSQYIGGDFRSTTAEETSHALLAFEVRPEARTCQQHRSPNSESDS